MVELDFGERETVSLSACDDADWYHDAPFEPVGYELVATDSVAKCAAFWHTFVNSPVVMDWIDNGYRELWETTAPAP
jgi:hypothetical protein